MCAKHASSFYEKRKYWAAKRTLMNRNEYAVSILLLF